MSDFADNLIANFSTASRNVQKARSTSNLELFSEAWNSLSGYIEELESRISELSQAVGLITTLKPTMVMDADHPLDMAKEVAEYVTVRIAELEAAQRQNWTPVSERLPDEGKPVWICTIWNEQHSGLFVNGYWTGLFRDFREGEVTHWMPLPELPEESKKW